MLTNVRLSSLAILIKGLLRSVLHYRVQPSCSSGAALLPRSFGRLLADYAYALYVLYNLNVTSLAAFVEFCDIRNDDAL